PYLYINQERQNWECWKKATPLPDPKDEPLFRMAPAEANPAQNYYPGFAISKGYGGQGYQKIYPPTGIAMITGVLAGLARTSRNHTLAHEALILAIARNSKLHLNWALRYDPQWDPESGAAGYKSAFLQPAYQTFAQAKQLSDQQILDHAAFPGYPVQQFASFGLVDPHQPMTLMFNEMQYKSMSAKDALARACATIQWATMPGCGPDNWEPYLVNDDLKNQADVHYRWKANSNETCRQDVPSAQKLPAPIMKAIPLTYTSTQSSPAKGVAALCTVGIVIEAVYMALFAWKRNEPVIKAASRIPSMLIFIGAMFTLGSVLM
ncbi:hypothetical protein HDV00_006850, partial [Rhizophlyctis rosea]